MDAPFLSYLDLLRDLGASLDQLSQLAQEKWPPYARMTSSPWTK